MSSGKKTKEQLAQEYLDDIMKFINEPGPFQGKIYPENIKDAYASGYLRATIDVLLDDIHRTTEDMSLTKWYKIKEDA